MQTLISYLILPFSFCILLIIAGLLIHQFSSRRRLGSTLFIAGLGLLLWFSSYPGSRIMLAPLEQMYEPLHEPDNYEADYVVVLGGGYNYDSTLPSTARLSSSSTRRLTEALRIRQHLPDATLVLSGGGAAGYTTTAEMMLQAMIEIDADTSDVILHNQPRNTEEEAAFMSERLHNRDKQSVVLVTSARHMPRSMALFRGQNIDVIPAPADHELDREEPWNLEQFVWSLRFLQHSHYAIHEYVGIVGSRIRGQAAL